MKLMNIVGWNRTKAQKVAVKAQRAEAHQKRLKREFLEYCDQKQRHRNLVLARNSHKKR